MRRLIILFVMTLIISFCLSSNADSLVMEDIETFNPEFVEQDYHSMMKPLLFQTLGDSNEIVSIRAVFIKEFNWQPWFDQPKDDPDRILGDGPLYSQTIFLAPPIGEAKRSLIEYWQKSFKAQLPLNFYDIKEFNPSLEFYEILPTPLDSESGFVFFSPPGQGIVFITEQNGDIYSIMQTGPGIIGVRPQDSRRGYHPDLGNIKYLNVYVKDPASQYCIDSWLAQ